jgi:hypothetical protein
MKEKKCKMCKSSFIPTRPMQTICSFECSIEYAKNKNKTEIEKKARKAKKEFKENDKSTLIKLAQTVVNKYIRLRDDKLPCCSCGHLEGRQFHSGHYENVAGKQQLRFYTLNINKQCSICNNYLSANLVPYRKFMIDKYGLEKVEWIENNNERGNYTVEYLQRLIKVFRKKIKLYQERFR